nr:unnamed protein product [Callosobruchus chinensis]
MQSREGQFDSSVLRP